MFNTVGKLAHFQNPQHKLELASTAVVGQCINTDLHNSIAGFFFLGDLMGFFKG